MMEATAQIHDLQQRAERQAASDADSLDTFLRLSSVKRILDSSKSTVWRWIQDPNIAFPPPVIRSGNVVLWSKRQVEAWQAFQLKKQRERLGDAKA